MKDEKEGVSYPQEQSYRRHEKSEAYYTRFEHQTGHLQSYIFFYNEESVRGPCPQLKGECVMEKLDAKNLRSGMRVITCDGKRTGTVRGVDIAGNRFAVLLDGENRSTLDCNPAEFKILTIPGLRLTGRPPPSTIPHSPSEGT